MKTNVETAVNGFRLAIERLQDLERHEIVQNYLKVQELVTEQENLVKEIVKDSEEEVLIPELSLEFQFIQPYKKFVDVKRAKELAAPDFTHELQELIEEEIPHDAFVKAVRENILPTRCLSACRETKMSPRIIKKTL